VSRRLGDQKQPGGTIPRRSAHLHEQADRTIDLFGVQAALRRSLDAAEIPTEFNRRLEERRTSELKGLMGCRSTRNSLTENSPWFTGYTYFTA
jgi:hypothetical protein